MARWEGGAPERLQRAALELFTARGFDRVTVAEIAAAAGLTERTFFRHYADKREVLFAGQRAVEGGFLAGLERSAGSDPMAMVRTALEEAATFFPEERRDWARARHRVIAANDALQERELLKLSSLAAAMTSALTARGLDPVPAALAAETALTVFRTAFAAWLTEDEPRPFVELQRAVLADLQALVARA